MTLQWQSVEIPLGSSQDESAFPFALPNPLLAKLQNARVYKTGAVGKRPGWLAGATAVGDRVLSVGDDVFTLKPHAPFSLTPGAAVALGSLNAQAQRIDYHAGSLGGYSISEIEVRERRTIQRDATSGDGLAPVVSNTPDFAVSTDNSVAVIAWTVSAAATPLTTAQNIVMAMAIDVRTRAVVTPPTQISSLSGTNNQPLCIVNDSTSIVVLYARAGGTQLRGVSYNTTTQTFGADTLIVSDLNGAGRFDAREYVGGTGWYLLYRNTTPVVKFAQMSGLAVSASNTIAEDPDAGGMAVYAEAGGGRLWMAWYNSVNGLRATVRSATSLGTVVVAPTTMETAVDTAVQVTWAPGATASLSTLIWTTDASVSLLGSGYGRKVSKFRSLDVTGVKGTQVSCADVTLISKGYAAPNGYTYAAFLYDASDVLGSDVRGIRSQENQVAFTMMVCDTELAPTGYATNSWRVAATWAQGEAGRKRISSSLGSFRGVTVDSDGTVEQWFMLAPEFDQILTGTATSVIAGRNGVDLCRQRITNTPPITATRIGNNVVFSGGVPQIWDGATLNEYGFFYPPENAKVVDGGAAATGLVVGSYGTQVVWEYRHATGDVARSVPSFPLSALGTPSVTVAVAGDKITATLPSLGVTRKWNDTQGTGGGICPADGVIARVYRTEVNGTLYYSEGDFTTTAGFVASAITGATPGGFVLSTDVKQSDATAITHAELYTTDNILPNFPPPALAFVYTHRNRLFGIVAENRRQVAFTHEYIVGELPGWHPDLVIDVPDNVVALSSIDEKLVLLCENGVYMVAGNGPDRKGLNSDYDQPYRLNSPHGCLTAASVVSFPNGIIYQAPTGFCLIDRQTTVTRIGGPVEDTLATYPYAHAAVVLDDREWIYWSMTDKRVFDASTVGRVVVYDWRHNVWSVDMVSYPGELSAFDTFVSSFARSGNDVYATVHADAAHVYHHEGFADPGPEWIYMYIKTAPIHLGSNSKYQRARWLTALGRREGIHQVAYTVTSFAHADSAAPKQQTFVWPELTTVVLPTYALKMHLANQKGAWFQVEIADGPDPAPFYGNSFTLTSLVVEMGLKGGTHQAPQAATE